MARPLSRPVLLAIVAVAVLAGVLVQRSSGEDLTAADRAFIAVCRDHGGAPSLAAGSGDYVKDARSCTVRYGGGTYEMYAVHADGWSEREAAAAHRTCVAQAREARAAAARGERVAATEYVWHARSGICEERRG
jgi:hypothetical protein